MSIKDYDDAMIWLLYWAKFSPTEELRQPADGLCRVLTQLKREGDEARARAAELAKKLEHLEAKQGGANAGSKQG